MLRIDREVMQWKKPERGSEKASPPKTMYAPLHSAPEKESYGLSS
jgi:hypothetical protein